MKLFNFEKKSTNLFSHHAHEVCLTRLKDEFSKPSTSEFSSKGVTGQVIKNSISMKKLRFGNNFINYLQSELIADVINCNQGTTIRISYRQNDLIQVFFIGFLSITSLGFLGASAGLIKKLILGGKIEVLFSMGSFFIPLVMFGFGATFYYLIKTIQSEEEAFLKKHLCNLLEAE